MNKQRHIFHFWPWEFLTYSIHLGKRNHFTTSWGFLINYVLYTLIINNLTKQLKKHLGFEPRLKKLLPCCHQQEPSGPLYKYLPLSKGSPCQFLTSTPFKSITGLTNGSKPSIWHSITSPLFICTARGVPVDITSPGSIVITLE